MAALSLLLPLGTLCGIVLALLNIREKLWPKAPSLHPLAAPLREGFAEVAAAIRERGPDLHVQLRDVPPAAERREP